MDNNNFYTTQDYIKAQKEYCNKHNYPLFIPIDGICWRCSSNIFYGERGYTMEDAKSHLITGCRKCGCSFCD